MATRGSVWSRLLVLMIGLIGCSCSVTRTIPEGKYLLKSVEIPKDRTLSKDERIPTTTLHNYVRQSPNKRLFGFNFYIWVYTQANAEKDNWWHNFLRKIGEKPVYVDLALTKKSNKNLKLYLNSQGYYSSSSEYKIDTLARRKRAVVTYTTHQGEPYTITDLKYRFQDTLIRTLIERDTVNSLIHRGDVFSVPLLDEERIRIASFMKNRGYYNFSVNNIAYTADTLSGDKTAKLEMTIKRELAGYDNRGNAEYRANRRYRLGEVNIVPNFDQRVMINDSLYKTKLDTITYKGINIITADKRGSFTRPNVRPSVLRQMVPMNDNDIYNASTVEQTYQNLMSLGYFKSARISFRKMKPDSLTKALALKDSAAKGSQRDTTEVNPYRYLSSYILCTPALKQSYDVQIEASTTSSFYGLYGTIGYQNRNIFRGAEAWDVDLSFGYEHMKAPDAKKSRATEIGISTGLSFPRFILPFIRGQFPKAVQPKTQVEVLVNLQDRPYYERTLSGASWSYTWRNKGFGSYYIRPIDINVIDMKYIDEEYYKSLNNDYLRNSYQTQLIAGLSLGYSYNNVRKNLWGNSTMLRINAETAGNSINAVKALFGSEAKDGYYEVFGIRYAQYVRGDINFSRRIAIGERSAVATRLYLGAGTAYGNSTAIPFDRLFYSGGSNSMRGWTPRTLGPGSSAEPEDDVYPSQLGDAKIEANIEFRFPLWENFHAATFLDAGNIWYLKDSEGVYDPAAVFDTKTFYKQLGFNTGVGLRLDIQFAVLRLDWGIQLHNPNKAEGERWVIKKFKLSNTAINFGVGYPF